MATITQKSAFKTPKKTHPKISIAQKDLTSLLIDSRATKDATEKVLDLLTDMRRQPSQIFVQPERQDEPQSADNANAKLTALLSLITGKRAQQVFEDILSRGKAPTAEDWMRETSKVIERASANRS